MVCLWKTYQYAGHKQKLASIVLQSYIATSRKFRDLKSQSTDAQQHFGNGIQQHCAEWPLKCQWTRAMTGGHMVAIAI